MVRVTGRGSSVKARIGRAIRLASICLLALAASGVLPAAGRCLEDIRGCERSTCTRCACRHRAAAHATVGVACPCCQAHPASTNHMIQIDPALVRGAARWSVVLETSGVVSDASWLRPVFTPSVPHPPPRTLTPA